MGVLVVILLAVSLSMDSLGIGISYGIRKIRVPLAAKLIICAISLLFTGLAVVVGSWILIIVPEIVAELIGVCMLAFLGVFIILSAVTPKKEKDSRKCKNVWSLALKPFGITVKIIRNPVSCDFDKSKHIDMFEAMYLGIALSIDSFAAGVSSVVSGISPLVIPLAAGVGQFVFLSLGEFIGKKIVDKSNIDSKVFVVISGCLLIVMAAIRWFC